jgi:mono/diheme cytochrome c family protein
MFEIPVWNMEHLSMKRVICLMTSLAISVPVSTVNAQEIGDTQNGLALSQQVCSDCHAIRRGQARSPNTQSPTFSELATTPGMTVGALTVALTTPHAGMPMFMLTADQRQDVIAYILGLR